MKMKIPHHHRYPVILRTSLASSANYLLHKSKPLMTIRYFPFNASPFMILITTDIFEVRRARIPQGQNNSPSLPAHVRGCTCFDIL